MNAQHARGIAATYSLFSVQRRHDPTPDTRWMESCVCVCVYACVYADCLCGFAYYSCDEDQTWMIRCSQSFALAPAARVWVKHCINIEWAYIVSGRSWTLARHLLRPPAPRLRYHPTHPLLIVAHERFAFGIEHYAYQARQPGITRKPYLLFHKAHYSSISVMRRHEFISIHTSINMN